MAYYNLTFANTSNTIMDVAVGVNTNTSGLLMALMLFVLFVMLFMVFKSYDTKIVLIADSFIVSIVAFFLWAAGLIGWHILIVPVVILVFSLLGKIIVDYS